MVTWAQFFTQWECVCPGLSLFSCDVILSFFACRRRSFSLISCNVLRKLALLHCDITVHDPSNFEKKVFWILISRGWQQVFACCNQFLILSGAWCSANPSYMPRVFALDYVFIKKLNFFVLFHPKNSKWLIFFLWGAPENSFYEPGKNLKILKFVNFALRYSKIILIKRMIVCNFFNVEARLKVKGRFVDSTEDCHMIWTQRCSFKKR